MFLFRRLLKDQANKGYSAHLNISSQKISSGTDAANRTW